MDLAEVNRAGFRDLGKTLHAFDFDFNRQLDRRSVFDLADGHFIARHEDALFLGPPLGPPGTGKSHPEGPPSWFLSTQVCWRWRLGPPLGGRPSTSTCLALGLRLAAASPSSLNRPGRLMHVKSNRNKYDNESHLTSWSVHLGDSAHLER